MKVALCLFGYFDSLQDKSSKGDDGFHHISKNILSKCDADIFIHNWQPNLQDHILDLYKPKKYVIENQIDFSKVAAENNLLRFSNSPRPIENILSQSYARKQTIELKNQYEKENNIKYDCVILSRFDLGRINRNSSREYPVQCINFNPSLDMSYMYCANWHLFNEGPADMWFYSNTNNINIFSQLYDMCLSSFKKDSEYFLSATTGWFDSKMNGFTSNEIFKAPTQRCSNLHKYPDFMIVNGILIIKWLFHKNNMWEKTKFLKTTWE